MRDKPVSYLQSLVEFMQSPGGPGPRIELAGYGYRWLRLSEETSPL